MPAPQVSAGSVRARLQIASTACRIDVKTRATFVLLLILTACGPIETPDTPPTQPTGQVSVERTRPDGWELDSPLTLRLTPQCDIPLGISEFVHAVCKPIRMEFEVSTDAKGKTRSATLRSVMPANESSNRLGDHIAKCLRSSRFVSRGAPATFRMQVNFDEPYGPRCAP